MHRRHALTLIKALGLISVSAATGLTLTSTVEAAEKKREDKKKGGGESYIQMPMIAVFVPTGRKNGTLTVELGLDVPDARLREKVTTYIPRLRDAFVGRLQAYAMTLNASKAIDADYVQHELQAQTDGLLQAQGARLLLGSIMVN